MLSLAIALESTIGGLGSPSESPGEMNSTFRRRRETENDGPPARRATVPLTRRHISGFPSSINESILSREIAKAEMRQLKLTPLETVTSRENVHAHCGDRSTPSPSHSVARMRGRSMSKLAGSGSASSLLALVPTDAYDADSEDSSEDSDTLEVVGFFGPRRARSPFSRPPWSRSGSDSASTSVTGVSILGPTDTDGQARVTFADHLREHVPPITTASSSADRKTSVLITSGLLDDDLPSSSRQGFLGRSRITSPILRRASKRKDSMPVLDHGLARKRVYGVDWLVVNDGSAGPDPAPFITADGRTRRMSFSRERSDDETCGSNEGSISPASE